MKYRSLLLSVLALMIPAALSLAQTAPAAQATSQPSVHRIELPKGTSLASITGRNVICETLDLGWVQRMLLVLEPAGRPSTRPVDVLHHIDDQRDALAKHFTEAGLTQAQVDSFFDDQLIPLIRQYRDLRVPTYYLAVSTDFIAPVIQKGWEPERFTVDTSTGKINFKSSLEISVDRPMDDVLIPVLFEPDSLLADRSDQLAKRIRQTELEIAREVAGRAQTAVFNSTAAYINDQIMAPLKLKADQQWFAVGIAQALAIQMTASVTGLREQDLVAQLTAQPGNSLTRMNTLDLLHPLDLSAMKEEFIPSYQDAFRRRSLLATYKLVHDKPESVGKVLAAIRQTPPADGAALAKVMHDISSIDVSSELPSR